MLKQLVSSVRMLGVLTLLTGVLYPLIVTAVAHLLAPHAAKGSLIREGERVVGSELLGQSFTRPGYLWGRPSATQPFPGNSLAGGGSNLGPTNVALREAVKDRVARLRAADPDNTAAIPPDLVMASASGLDPHITPAAAEYQIARVARERGLTVEEVRSIVAHHTEGRWLGLLGQPRVHVLRANMELDRVARAASAAP